MMGRTDPSLCEVAGPADDELTSRLTGFSGNETANSIPSTSASAFVGDFNLKQDAEGSKHDTHAHHHDGQQPTTSGDLPPNFSLLAPISVPITVNSSEILDLCKKRHERSAEYKPVFDEKVPPPRPPKIPEIKMPTDKVGGQHPTILVPCPHSTALAEAPDANHHGRKPERRAYDRTPELLLQQSNCAGARHDAGFEDRPRAVLHEDLDPDSTRPRGTHTSAS